MNPSTEDDGSDFVMKCIVIGDAGTGKSCILHQFLQGEFKKGPAKHTVGVEFGSRQLHVGTDRVRLQIWDTAGQERFRSVCQSYYRGARGALLVYDITDEESFEHLARWVEDVRALAGKEVTIVVCGNKCDLEDEREVDLLDGSRFAQEQNAMFLETSALTGQNINEVFHMCARAFLTKVHNHEILDAGLPSSISKNVNELKDPNESFCAC